MCVICSTVINVYSCDLELLMKNKLHLAFFFLGCHPQHMEVTSLRVESKLQLLAYITATAMPESAIYTTAQGKRDP